MSVIDSSIVFLLEPLHSFFFANSVLCSYSAFASSSKANSTSWSFKDNIEIHTKNTSKWIILDTQINVLLNTKSKATSVREVSLFQLSVLDF